MRLRVPVKRTPSPTILAALGCIGSVVVAAVACQAGAFAAWMTALPPGHAVMSLAEARSQFWMSAVVLGAAGLGGAWAVVRLFQLRRRPSRD